MRRMAWGAVGAWFVAGALTGCASSGSKPEESESPEETLCVTSGIHVAAILAGKTEAEIREATDMKAVHESCRGPEAKTPANQATLRCGLAATDMDGLNKCREAAEKAGNPE